MELPSVAGRQSIFRGCRVFLSPVLVGRGLSPTTATWPPADTRIPLCAAPNIFTGRD